MNKLSGQVIVIATVIMVIIYILVLGLLVLALTELESFKSQFNLIKASYIADAGIENAIYFLRRYGELTWEWGDPNYQPATTQSGTHCWATRLNKNYRNNIVQFQERLITPTREMTSTGTRYLRFCHQLRVGNANDAGYIELSRDEGLTWTQIAGPYNVNVTAWTVVEIPFAVSAGEKINIAFSFESDGNLTAPGWYIDNIMIDDVSAVGSCAAPAAPYDFFDDCEQGVGDWWVMLKPDNNSPHRFPYDSVPASQFFVTPEASQIETDTWILTSRGRVINTYNKSEAKVTVHGDAEPYNIKIHYWKRGI